MNEENINNNDSEKSAPQILQEINAGQLDPKLLDPEGRKRCIEVLMSEGYTISHMAQILKRNEKTIRRDLKEIRARCSLLPSKKFSREFIGRLVLNALNHSGYLMRVGRSKDALPGEKTQAEFAAWKIIKELTEVLQRLGYLPLVSMRTSAANDFDSEKQVNVSADEASETSEVNREVFGVLKAMAPMDRERLLERLMWIMTGDPKAAKFTEIMSSIPGEITKWLMSPESNPT